MADIQQKQISLRNFIKEFGVPRSTAVRMIRTKGFPSYKVLGRWYIDLPQYYKWREVQDRNNRKFG